MTDSPTGDDTDLPVDKWENFDLTLLANFVHQVVNPLNGVAGTLDNLAEGLVDGEARKTQRLNAARAQIEQCITLMRNLAFLAQGSGGVADQDRRQIVLPQVIIESAMFFQEDGKSKSIKISLSDRVTQNKVAGHPELIRQVLMNIFDNCIKYGKRGSKVDVNQWVQAGTGSAIITISSESEHPVDAADLKRICELGFRGKNARRVIASGTGLGLYICKEIIERVHGGVFHIQSSGQDGILFTVKLPRAEAV
jgi:signal transduction histidine kinase